MEPSRIREEADKALARRSLLHFTKRTKVGYQASWIHWMLAQTLMLVERGLLDRVAIEMPPRHGKSELASIRFPAWYLGRNPTKQFVAASHTQDLADEFSGKARDVIKSEYWPFPKVRIAGNAWAVRRWKVDAKGEDNKWRDEGGVYVPVGVGGGLTGKGADILSIDDPVKDWVQADSELIRESHWYWYQSVASTRLMPGAACVMTLTRWHQDDILGRALKLAADFADADQWFEIKLPALSDGPRVFADIQVPDKIAREAGIDNTLDVKALFGKLWALV